LHPFTPLQTKAISGGLVIFIVILLYRRITTIGKISVLLWIGRRGNDAMADLGRGHAFQTPGSRLIFRPAPSICRGVVRGTWLRDGEHDLQLLGYYNICHLGSESKIPKKYPPRHFSFRAGDRVLYLAMQTSLLGVVPWREAQNSDFIASLFVTIVWTSGGALRDRNEFVDCGRIRVFRFARCIACSVFRGSGRESSSPCLARVHPLNNFRYISLLVRLACIPIQYFAQVESRPSPAFWRCACYSDFIGRRLRDAPARRRGTQGLPFKIWAVSAAAVLTMIGWAWLFWQTGPTRKGDWRKSPGSFGVDSRAGSETWPFGSSQSTVSDSQ